MWKDKSIRVTIIVGIVTLVITLIATMVIKPRRAPVYSILNEASLIYDRENASPKIRLILNDSINLDENVYINTIALWNKGKLSINKEDIRKEFYIYCTGDDPKILDYKIIKEHESGVSNFRLFPEGDSLRLIWDYFDHNYGCLIQLLYTGNKETDLKITGVVLGSNVKLVYTKQEPSLMAWIVLVMTMIGSIVMTMVFVRSVRMSNPDKKLKQIQVIVLLLAYLGMAIFTIVKYKKEIFSFEIPF